MKHAAELIGALWIARCSPRPQSVQRHVLLLILLTKVFIFVINVINLFESFATSD